MHTEAKQLIHACMTGTVHTLAYVMHTKYECSDSLENNILTQTFSCWCFYSWTKNNGP